MSQATLLRVDQRLNKGMRMIELTERENNSHPPTPPHPPKEQRTFKFRFSSHFSSFLTVCCLSVFCSLTKGIIPKICRRYVCVVINKRSFEAFVCENHSCENPVKTHQPLWGFTVKQVELPSMKALPPIITIRSQSATTYNNY